MQTHLTTKTESDESDETDELIGAVYRLQGSLKLLAEMLATSRPPSIGQKSRDFIWLADCYLVADMMPRIH